MAILQEQRSQQSFYLGSLHVFGRNPSRADTVLNNADASQYHALIRWNGALWEMVDHSRYGTMIDDLALKPHTKIPLALGQTIRFAAGATQSFVVISLDPPCPMLLPVGHDTAAIALNAPNALYLLPDEINPQASLHLSGNGQWLWDDMNGSTPLHDGDQVHVAGQCWRFFNKLTVDATIDVSACCRQCTQDAHFKFLVSQNEEHIQLAITAHDRQIHLGERSHHYCLLTLARQRFQDARQGFDALSQGWISTAQFANMLKVEEKHLNMLLHRARHHIAKECPAEPLVSHCIERRRGEVRFGGFRFQITRGQELEADFDPRHIASGGNGSTTRAAAA